MLCHAAVKMAASRNHSVLQKCASSSWMGHAVELKWARHLPDPPSPASPRAEEGETVVGLSNSPLIDAFLSAILSQRERKEGAGTDLCSVCQWSHPRSRAQRCGTWPPSGLSAWPCCCGWRRAELRLSRVSPSPQPGSPPVTEYRSSPSLAEQAACERRSCQSQHDRQERGKEKAGEQSQWLGFCCVQHTCCNMAS